MKTIISYIFLLIVCFSCKTNSPEKIEKIKTNTNLASIQIPKKSTEHEFDNLKIIDWGYDYFEEKLFDSIQKSPIQKKGFQKEIQGTIYPYGWIDRATYPIYFYLKTQKEAGLIEPIIMAYIVDKQKELILDSLEVHKRFEWEGSYHKYFEITKDSILIVYEKEMFDPNYGDDSESITTEKHFKISKYYLKSSFRKIPNSD